MLSLEQGTSKTCLTRFLNVHYMSLASELSAERGPKKETVFNTRYSAYASLAQSKLPSDTVQGQRPTSSLPSAFGILGERDAVVLYWEEEQCHLGWGLPQYKNMRLQDSSNGKECADTGFIYSSKTAKNSLTCWKTTGVCRLVFPRNNSDKKICSFSWSGHSKWKSNLASKNKQLMLFSVKKILWSWKTLQDVKRNCHSLRGILGSCSIQMVTKYKIWPFKSETLLHSISIGYPTYWWG